MAEKARRRPLGEEIGASRQTQASYSHPSPHLSTLRGSLSIVSTYTRRRKSRVSLPAFAVFVFIVAASNYLSVHVLAALWNWQVAAVIQVAITTAIAAVFSWETAR